MENTELIENNEVNESNEFIWESLEEVQTNVFDQLQEYWFLDWFVTWFVSILVYIWVWSILWTTKDISSRTYNIFLQIFSIVIVAVLTPVFWLPIYFLIRPNRFKFDQIYWREALAILVIKCEYCWEHNHKDNKFCVHCWSNIVTTCKECKSIYPKNNEYCYKCWAPNLELD